jgi:O-antigen ligase
LILAITNSGGLPSKAIGFLTAGSATLITFATASRGSLIALLAAGGIYTLAGIRASRTRLLWTLLLTAITLIAGSQLIHLLPDQAIQRISVGAAVADRAGGRIDIWQLALRVGLSNPITGAGFGGFHTIAGATFTDAIQVHNTFLLFLAELGLTGLVLWSTMWLTHWRLVRKLVSTTLAERTVDIALHGSLAALVVGASSLNWEFRNPIYLIWGIIAAASRIQSEIQSNRTLSFGGRIRPTSARLSEGTAGAMP